MRALAALLAFFMLLPAMAIAGQHAAAADSLGWQEDTFAKNVRLEYIPANPTPSEPVVVSVTSLDSRVWIQVTFIYLTIRTVDGRVATPGLTLSKVNDTVWTCTLSTYPNGTVVTFHVNVLDSYNVSMVSDDYTYTVFGSDIPGGWAHNDFDRNVAVNVSTTSPKASENVKVIINSIENTTIYRADLRIIYQLSDGTKGSGGFVFRLVNTTYYEVEIPGYPSGTALEFWITAYDKYYNWTESAHYNYTVQEAQNYTAHDFVPSLEPWAFPGLAGVVVLGIISYAVMSRREKRRRERGDDYMKGGAK